jgi:general secretion pathway protein K
MISHPRQGGPVRDRSAAVSDVRRSEGIVLAIVLVMIFALITAVYAFQRRAVIDTSIASNRLRVSEAEALARGGLRIGEAIVFLSRLKMESGDDAAGAAALATLTGSEAIPTGDLWAEVGEFPIELENGRTLRIEIQDEGAKLNLNALVDPTGGDGAAVADDEAEAYLVDVLEYIIDGIDAPPEDRVYDARAIARNLLDYMDADDVARDGRVEDAYYRAQDPPYRARNGPFLTIDEIGLVEGVDPQLLRAMRDYVTIHPIGAAEGIHLNRATPWVLSLVYTGVSGDRELMRPNTVRDLWRLRQEDKLVCDDPSADPERCVSPNEIGSGELAEGSIYPPISLPAQPSVFRVVAEATVGDLTRRLEAVYDTRPLEGPQLLSWRRLRGPDS